MSSGDERHTHFPRRKNDIANSAMISGGYKNLYFFYKIAFVYGSDPDKNSITNSKRWPRIIMNTVHVTDADLRKRIAAEFGDNGGGARLARALGVSPSTASLLLAASPKASLIKPAAYYGFEPGADGGWTESPWPRDPSDVGYQRRWTEEVVAELRAMMSRPRGSRPRVSDVAKRAGVTQSTLRGVMARAHIRLRHEGDNA